MAGCKKPGKRVLSVTVLAGQLSGNELHREREREGLLTKRRSSPMMAKILAVSNRMDSSFENMKCLSIEGGASPKALLTPGESSESGLQKTDHITSAHNCA